MPLRVPETDLPLAVDPPPPPAAPATGPVDAADSRSVVLRVLVGATGVELGAWCRVGVWTTLERVRARAFVVREAWGRLGEREPRLLARVQDQVLDGVVARVRPERDGGLSFVVEVSESRLNGNRIAGIYHGQKVNLPAVRRHGYRLAGRAPAGWRGRVACWLPGPVVLLGSPDSDARPLRGVSFRNDSVEGFVAGERVHAEAFLEEWVPARPVLVEADGVERQDFRLVTRRSAAGVRTDGGGGVIRYGAAFEVRGLG